MQSTLLNTQEFAYLTVTGEGIAAEVVEKYRLRPNDAWDAGEIIYGQHQFEKMCLRFQSAHSDKGSMEQDISSLLMSYRAQHFHDLPDDFVRTLHCVIYGYHWQTSGCYLESDNIRTLAQMKAEVSIYIYKIITEGNHEFPYSKQLQTNEPSIIDPNDDSNSTGEYAYFYVRSNTLHADKISEILQLKPSRKNSIGEPKRKNPTISPMPLWEWSSWYLDSGIEKGQPIAVHLEAVMGKLMPRIDQLYLLSRDYQTSFGLSSTGSFPISNQINLNRNLIRQMAELNLSFDFDAYLDYE